MKADDLPALLAGLRSTDPDDRLEAAYLIGEIGDRRATLALLDALRLATLETDYYFRQAACAALGKLGDGRALPSLLAIARGLAGSGRREAIEALGQLGKKEAIPVLLDALSDARVRRVAGRALGRLGSPEVVHGWVVIYDSKRRFGFIRPAARKKPVFFSLRDFDANESPRPGMHVTFYSVVVRDRRQAVRVRPVAAAPKQLAVATAGTAALGTVRWFDRAKGLGFARLDGGHDDVLLHRRDVEPGLEPSFLRARARIAFEAVRTSQGLRAHRLRPA